MVGNELGATNAPTPSAEAAVKRGAPNLEHEPGRQAVSNLQASMNGCSAKRSASRSGPVETGTIESSITGHGAFPADAVEPGTRNVAAAFADVLV
jgi:hypothetical protein